MEKLIILLLINFGSIDANGICDDIQDDNIIEKVPYMGENSGDHCFFELDPKILETIALDDENRLDTVGNYFAMLQTECNKIKGSTLPVLSDKEILQFFMQLFLRLHKNKYVALDVQIVKVTDEKIQVLWGNDNDNLVDANNVLESTIPGLGKRLIWNSASISAITFFRGDDSTDLISFKKDVFRILNATYVPYCHYAVHSKVWNTPGVCDTVFGGLLEAQRNKALRPEGRNVTYFEYENNARKVCNENVPGSFLPSLFDKELMETFIQQIANKTNVEHQIALGGKVLKADIVKEDLCNVVRTVMVQWDDGVTSTMSNVSTSGVYGIVVNKTLKMVDITRGEATQGSLIYHTNNIIFQIYRHDNGAWGGVALYCHYVFPSYVSAHEHRRP